MQVPALGKTKDLDFCKYILMMFRERLFMFQEQVVNPSPSIKTSGMCGDIDALESVAVKMMDRLEKMKGKVG